MNDHRAAIRFANVTIPAGATVLNANLSLTAKALTGTIPALTIRARAVDNAAAPISDAEFTTMEGELTTTSVVWTPPSWTLNTTYASPDLAGVVAEVVGRAGWLSGNAILLHLRSTATSSDQLLTAYDYGDDPLKVAQLEVTYSSLGRQLYVTRFFNAEGSGAGDGAASISFRWRLEATSAGAGAALGLLETNNEVALWTLSEGLGEGTGPSTLSRVLIVAGSGDGAGAGSAELGRRGTIAGTGIGSGLGRADAQRLVNVSGTGVGVGSGAATEWQDLGTYAEGQGIGEGTGAADLTVLGNYFPHNGDATPSEELQPDEITASGNDSDYFGGN